MKIYAVKIGDPIWNALYGHKEETYSINAFFEEEDQKYAVLQNESNYYRLNFSIGENDEVVFAEEMTDITESYTPATEAQFALADVEAFEVEFKTWAAFEAFLTALNAVKTGNEYALSVYSLNTNEDVTGSFFVTLPPELRQKNDLTFTPGTFTIQIEES